MATVTLLGTATFTTANGTKTVTATPAVDDLILIVTAHTGNTSSTGPTDNNLSGTYSLIVSCSKVASTDTLRIWARNSKIAVSTSTIFTHAPGTTTGGGLVVLKATGMVNYGSLAALQSGSVSNGIATTTPTVTISAPSTNNAIIGVCFNGTNPATLTPRTSYTELSDIGYNNPTTGLEVMIRNSGETATSIAWGGTSGSIYGALVVELNTSFSTKELGYLGVG